MFENINSSCEFRQLERIVSFLVGVFICLSINFESGYAADSAETLRIGFIGPLRGKAAILGVDTVHE